MYIVECKVLSNNAVKFGREGLSPIWDNLSFGRARTPQYKGYKQYLRSLLLFGCR